MRKITKEQLCDIAYGACFLASGGGGPLEVAHTLIENTISDGPENDLRIVSVEEAAKDEDKVTAVVAYVGAPSSLGKIRKPRAPLNAFDRLDAYCRRNLGKSIGYVIPVESGAVSTVVPFLVALERNLSVVDGDGARRSDHNRSDCMLDA